MPRNITVTLANGVKHVYANAPDNVTPQQVQARAEKEFGHPVSAIDGGRSAPVVSTAPPVPGSVAAFQQRWANMRPEHAAGILQRFSAQAAAQGPTALKAFNARPDAQALKTIAGSTKPSLPATPATAPAPVTTGKIAEVAQAAADNEGGGNYLNAIQAGFRRGMFGIPERLAAAAERFLPSAITGNTTDASYDNILQAVRDKTDAEMRRAPITAQGASLAGNVVTGGAAGGLVKAGAARLAAAGDGVISGVGNVISKATTQATATVGKGLTTGEKVANAARLVAAGAAGGGTQAAGEGGDVTTGAVGGGVGAGVAGGVGKLLSVAAQPVKAILGLSTAPQILSKFTSVTKEAMQAAAEKYRAITGAEPTLFELLPPADRSKIMKNVVAGKDAVVDQATKAIADRAKTLGPDMAAKVQAVVDPARATIKDKIVGDLAKARGVEPANLAAEDHTLIDKAMTNSTDMEALRGAEVKAHMDPHNATPVVDNLHDLYPKIPGSVDSKTGEIGPDIAVDPEVNSLIRNSAGTIPLRPQDAGVDAGDVSNIMQNLRGYLGGSDPGKAITAQRALDHIQGVLEENAPEAGKASAAATDAYAARSRMMEGMDAGMTGNLRDTVQTRTSGNAARLVRNAFDTPEGKDGLALGQSNALTTDLGGGAADALKATLDISRGRTSREMTQNLGQDASDKISAAAQAQDESAQVLSQASSKANGAGDPSTGTTMVNALIGMHPGGFAATKAHALVKLSKMVVVPENRAKTIVDMLFSQDKGLQSKAMDALAIVPGGQNFLRDISGVAGTVAGGGVAAPAQDNPNDQQAPDITVSDKPDFSGQPTPDAPDAAPEPDAPAADPNTPSASPYAGLLAQLQKDENPDVLKFADGIANAESNGEHFDPNGHPKISRVGAVGLMQVMPKYLPDFAKAGGLPVDHDALYHDPTYNKLVGIAQASALLRHFGGDTAKAAAGYNAGAGAVDHAVATNPDNWLASLPDETQGYVPKVLS